MRHKLHKNHGLTVLLAAVLTICAAQTGLADDWDFPALGFKCSPKKPHVVESVRPGYAAQEKGVLVGDEITDLESGADGTNFVIKRAGKTYGVSLSSRGFHNISSSAPPGALPDALPGSSPGASRPATNETGPLPYNALVPRNRLLSQPESRLPTLSTNLRPGAKFDKANLLALGQPAADWEVTPEWIAGDWKKVAGTAKVFSARNEKTGRDFTPTDAENYVLDGPNMGSARDKLGNIWSHPSVPEMVSDKEVALIVEPADPGLTGSFALHYRNVFVTTNASEIITACTQEDVIDRFSPQGADTMVCDQLERTYDEYGSALSSWRSTCQFRRVKPFVPNPGAKYTLPIYLRKRGLPQLIP